MSFDVLGIGIKIDPADSVAKADSATTALHKTEDAGIAAGKAMLGLAGSFKSLAQAMAQHQAALDRNAASHRFLNSTMAAAAGAFGKMAEAIQREQQMLERIHGPAQRYAADLQTLDSLLQRNAISAAEYAKQVTRLNHEIDGAPKAANSNIAAAPPRPSALGALGSLRGAAGALGVTVAASQIIGLADEYTNLQNRIRLMTPDQERANQLFEKLQGIATRSRADLGSTVDAYAGMSRATRALGLSQDETLRATETLNKLVATSGRSAAESSAGLMQFSQALSSGRLQGDELRSVFENMPSLVDALMASLGKTQAELREMGSAGQITSKIMVDALLQASGTADATLGKSIPTLSQSFVQFKNEMMITFGELNRSLGITDALGSAMSALGMAIKVVVAPLKEIGRELGELGISGSTATEVLGAAALTAWKFGGPAGAVVGTTVALIKGVSALGDWQKEMNAARLAEEQAQLVAEQLVVAQQKVNDTFAQGGEAFQQAQEELAVLNIRALAGADAANAFARGLANAGAVARAIDFKKLFTDPDGIDQFKNLTNGGFRRNEVDEANAFLANTGKVDPSGLRAGERVIEREKAVQAAQKELDALERQWASYQHGGTTLALYRQEKEQLLAVINGTVAATRKEKEAQLDLDAIIRANVAARERAANLAKNFDRVDFPGGDSSYVRKIGIDAAGLAQQAELEGRVLAVLNQIETPMEKYEASLREIQELYDLGAISAENYNAATEKLWMGTEKAKSLEASAKQVEENARRVQEAWASGLGSIAGSFVSMAAAGELSFGKLLDQAAKLALQMAAMQMGGSSGAFMSSFGGALLGGFAGGGSFSVPNDNSALLLPRAANGARWTVGGSGGVDSKIAMFRVTPGEHVDVRTPAQVAMGGGVTAEMFGQLLAAIREGASPNIVITDDSDDRSAGYSAMRRQTRIDRRGGRAVR